MYQHSGYERTPPPRRQRRQKKFRIRMLPLPMGPQNLPSLMKNCLPPVGWDPSLTYVVDDNQKGVFWLNELICKHKRTFHRK